MTDIGGAWLCTVKRRLGVWVRALHAVSCSVHIPLVRVELHTHTHIHTHTHTHTHTRSNRDFFSECERREVWFENWEVIPRGRVLTLQLELMDGHSLLTFSFSAEFSII